MPREIKRISLDEVEKMFSELTMREVPSKGYEFTATIKRNVTCKHPVRVGKIKLSSNKVVTKAPYGYTKELLGSVIYW